MANKEPRNRGKRVVVLSGGITLLAILSFAFFYQESLRHVWWTYRFRSGTPEERTEAAWRLAEITRQLAAAESIGTSALVRISAELRNDHLLDDTLPTIGGEAFSEILRSYPTLETAERPFARHALAILKPACTAVPDLVKTLEDERLSDLRGLVVHALGRLQSEARETVPLLARTATSADAGVRLAALKALKMIHADPQISIPVFISALRDPEPIVRAEAAFALGLWEDKARTAAPTLRAGVGDSDKDVLNAIEWALARIEGERRKDNDGRL